MKSKIKEGDVVSHLCISKCSSVLDVLSHCGPSAPILEGKAAEEFLKTIKQNKNKKVPKESCDRAKENYKKFKVI